MKSKIKTKCSSIELPRGYISWSQLTTWEGSPERYIKHYVYGEETFVNDEMRFGGYVARELEKGKSDNLIIDMLVSVVPKYAKSEHKLEVDLEEIKLFGILDSFCPKTKNIIEYKTGKEPWTQNRADEHGQLHFYALMVWLKYKKIPKIKLVWIQTIRGNGIEITGEVKEFEVEIKLIDILKMANRIKKVAYEIAQAYKAEIN